MVVKISVTFQMSGCLHISNAKHSGKQKAKASVRLARLSKPCDSENYNPTISVRYNGSGVLKVLTAEGLFRNPQFD